MYVCICVCVCVIGTETYPEVSYEIGLDGNHDWNEISNDDVTAIHLHGPGVPAVTQP